MRTFIHHDGALGDTLLSLPCFRRLRADSGRLHIAGRRDVVEFLKKTGIVDGALPSDSAFCASLFRNEADPKLRAFLGEFDRACVFTIERDSPAAAAIRASIPRTRVVTTIPPAHLIMHIAEYRLSQLAPQARLSKVPAALSIAPCYVETAKAILHEAGFEPGRPLIALHPGSGGSLKCWPLERYFQLVERLRRAYDCFTIIFTGPAENEEVKKRIDAFSAHGSVLHAAEWELIIAVSLLSLCNVSIGNDSGFSHLAAAVCRTIVLFGPTDPRLWKPVGSNVDVISAGTACLPENFPLRAVLDTAAPFIMDAPGPGSGGPQDLHYPENTPPG